MENTLCEAFRNSRLSNAWFADENGVVFGASRKDLDHASNLFIAANDRVEFVLGCLRDEIDPIFLQSLELTFGVLVSDARAASNDLQAGENVCFRNAQQLDQATSFVFGAAQPQKQMLRAGIVIFHGFCGRCSCFQRLLKRRAHGWLASA